MTNDGLQLLTDSSGSLECGAFFQNKWIVLQWPTEWNRKILQDITFLELVHIVLAVTTWCKQLRNKKVIFHVDNLALVDILNSKSSKSSRVISLLRPLVLIKGLYFILWAISNLNWSVTFQVLYGVLLKCRWLFLLVIFSRYIYVITGIARGWDEIKTKEISPVIFEFPKKLFYIKRKTK